MVTRRFRSGGASTETWRPAVQASAARRMACSSWNRGAGCNPGLRRSGWPAAAGPAGCGV